MYVILYWWDLAAGKLKLWETYRPNPMVGYVYYIVQPFDHISQPKAARDSAKSCIERERLLILFDTKSLI